MIHRKKDRHVLSHTIEHLFGVFFILGVAMTVSYFASAQTTVIDNIPPSDLAIGVVSSAWYKVELQFHAVDNVGVESYDVFRRDGATPTSNDFLRSIPSTTGTQGTSFADTTVLPGKLYFYAIKARDAAGNISVLSMAPAVAVPQAPPDTVPPSTVASFSVTSIAFGQINLAWSPASDERGIASYKLFKNGTPFSVQGLSYTDVNVEPGVMYSYYIKAVDPTGNQSVASAIETATAISAPTASSTPAPIPPPPPTVTPPPLPSTTTTTQLIEVSFSIQPAPKVLCDTGKPLTPVFLAVTKPLGGGFLITSDTGMSNAPLSWGEYPLPNGNYQWRSYVNPGYIGVGELFGSFALQNACPLSSTASPSTTTTPAGTTSTLNTTTTTNTATSNTTTVVKPDTQVLPRAQINLFLDNKPITNSMLFDQQIIEVRIATAISSRVELKTIDGLGGTKILGEAVIDDLLSRPGVDIWTYEWDLGKFPVGAVQLFASVTHEDGRVSVSERMSIAVKHSVVSTQATAPVSAVNTSVRVSQAERESILERVDDPASCANNEECRIYCRSNRIGTEKCLSFAQEELPQFLNKGGSLTDGISDEVLSVLLRTAENRPNDIPDIIEQPNELRQYCADAMHVEICTTILLDADLATKDDLLLKKEDMRIARIEERKLFTERVGARLFLDTDDDGVTDYDEVNIYKTNPANGDTDADGFQDGAEILARTNPRGGESMTALSSDGTSTAMESDESMDFENPIFAGTTESALLVVQNVEVAEVGMGEMGTATAKKLKLAGRAMPNSFVTLYVFSDPIVVTVKADAAGSWTYTLDKELPDGTHQVYSAITDGGGRILAKSQPLPFVKVAAAVSVGSPALLPQTDEPGFFSGASLYAMIAIMLALLGVALSIIGFIVRQKNDADGMSGT